MTMTNTSTKRDWVVGRVHVGRSKVDFMDRAGFIRREMNFLVQCVHDAYDVHDIHRLLT